MIFTSQNSSEKVFFCKEKYKKAAQPVNSKHVQEKCY